MDPVTGAVLGGVFNLFGASRRDRAERRAIDRQNAYNDPAAIRARYEAAGFNPLLGIAPGVDLQTATGGSGFLGSALAESGAQIAEGLTRRAPEISRMQRITQENHRLREQNQTLRLSPPVPSVYDRGGPSVRPATGVDNGNTGQGGESRTLRLGGFPVVSGPAGGLVVLKGKTGGASAVPTTQTPKVASGPAASDKGTNAPTNPMKIGGFEIFPSGDNSDAAVAEDRYGDGVISELVGIGSSAYDIAWNIGRAVKNRSTDRKYRTKSADGSDPGSYNPGTLRFNRARARDAMIEGYIKTQRLGFGARRQDY